MTERQKDSSEKNFQERFVQGLVKYKWSAPEHLDGNLKKVTVDDLIENWRRELNRLNADQLEGVPLTDNEFKQVMGKVSQINNSFEAAKLLAIEESKGKIDGIYRDPNPRVTREQITLTIFKKAQVSGGDSNYQIAREVVTKNGNRFDIVLLINGLPLINIEQKRTDKDLIEAFGQFKRYYADGEYSNNFMAFSQMMVIISEIATRYFATPKSLDEFNLSFVFRWADKNNNPVNDWKKVIEYFLMVPMAHQMVGDYLVIDEALNEENKRHMLMRPYQVYALQAVEGAAFGWDNDGVPHGGFVWHTTGSGKTITSFKTALFLSTRAGFDKIIFLVDRRELDNKTSENFKAYAHYEAVTVDDTKHTYELGKHLKSPKSGIVVTTTFKLDSLIKNLLEASDDSIRDNKFVFIIDEAHRTTMGHMMGAIKRYFKKNSLFFGFTGTPLFEENKKTGMINEKSEVINTTEKLFGPLLHQYTIDEAISDGNVLGFHVDYINTGEFKGYEDLREQLIDRIAIEKPHLSDYEIERMVASWDELEVEKQAVRHQILRYDDKTHIPRVVEYILKNWDSQSQGREFNAILTVAYKDRVIKYYEEFKKQLAESDQVLNVAMTFSFGNENDPDNVANEVLEYMFEDYEKFTGIKFIPGNNRNGEAAYFEDIVDRTTRGGSGRNPKNIDLVIVADQLLTGYDSKRLNTLYVDRDLKLQGLIQAYSRTNRILNRSKEFGTIVNFQYPRITEDIVKKALILYGSGGTSSKAIVDKYETAVNKLRVLIEKLIEIQPNPSDWELIKDNVEAKEAFNVAFLNASAQMNIVRQYYEFRWDDEAFGLDEHTWMKYIGAYKNLNKDKNPPWPIEPVEIVGRTKLVRTQKITAAHIIELIGKKSKPIDGKQVIDDETRRLVYEQIKELSDMGEYIEAELLKEFIETELLESQIPTGISFDYAFTKWKTARKKMETKEYGIKWGVKPDLIYKSLSEYSTSEPDIIPFYEDITKDISIEKAAYKSAENDLLHYMKFTNDYPKWLAETAEKYGDN